MTVKKFRHSMGRSDGTTSDDSMAATEIAALLGDDCPKDGSVFVHFRVRAAILDGNAEGRSVWERYRKKIMNDAKFLVGTRPRAWWIFDAPHDAPKKWLNVPADAPPYAQYFKEYCTPQATQQMQAQYLHAHGLLPAAERKKLPKEWFGPATPQLKVISHE